MSRRESSPGQPRVGPTVKILTQTGAVLLLVVVLVLTVLVVGRNHVISSAQEALAADFAETSTTPPHNQRPETLDRDLARVLVLDGGGIRGLITLEILAALEEKTGRRAGELFDVIAGSSTGGIIATLLTLPGNDGRPRFSARDLVQIYREFSANVFRSSPAYKIFTLDGFIGPRFPRLGLRELLIDKIGSVHMADLTKPIWFPSYSDTAREPFFFRSREVSSAEISGSDEYLVADAIIAATTVPGIFMPAEIKTTEGGSLGLILDGTIYAPNPVISAILGAGHLYPGKALYLVSLGTGGAGSSFGVKEASGWGMVQWLPRVLETMAHAQAVFENDFARLDNLPDGRPLCAQYHRIDKPYNAGWSSWFDISRKNMDALTAFGSALAREEDAQINRIARDLVAIGQSSGAIAQQYRESAPIP